MKITSGLSTRLSSRNALTGMRMFRIDRGGIEYSRQRRERRNALTGMRMFRIGSKLLKP